MKARCRVVRTIEWRVVPDRPSSFPNSISPCVRRAVLNSGARRSHELMNSTTPIRFVPSLVPPIALLPLMYPFATTCRRKPTPSLRSRRRRGTGGEISWRRFSLINGVRPASTKKHSEPDRLSHAATRIPARDCSGRTIRDDRLLLRRSSRCIISWASSWASVANSSAGDWSGSKVILPPAEVPRAGAMSCEYSRTTPRSVTKLTRRSR
jgi:hypothetical protein